MDLAEYTQVSLNVCVLLCKHSYRSELPLIIDWRSLAHVLAESVAKQELRHARDICERDRDNKWEIRNRKIQTERVMETDTNDLYLSV